MDIGIARQQKDPVAAAEPALQTTQVGIGGVARRGRGARWQAFDVELRKSPPDVGDKPWPFGRGRGAEYLDGRRELAMPMVDRGRDLVRPVDQKGDGDDQVNRDDRGDDQYRDLSADAPEIQKARELHGGLPAESATRSTVGVNM